MEIDIKATLVMCISSIDAKAGDCLIIYNGVCIGVRKSGRLFDDTVTDPIAEPVTTAIPTVRLGSVPSPMQDKIYALILERDGLTVSNIAEIVDVPTGNITSAVNGLLNKNLIVRNKGTKPYTYSVKENKILRMRRT